MVSWGDGKGEQGEQVEQCEQCELKVITDQVGRAYLLRSITLESVSASISDDK